MLRHLLISAARTSSRSLFAKPNALVYVSSLRTLSSQKLSSQISPLSQKQSSLGHEPFQKPGDGGAQFSKRPFSQKKSGSGQGEPSEPQMASLWVLAGVGVAGLLMHDQRPQRSHSLASVTEKLLLPEQLLCQHDSHPKLEKAKESEVAIVEPFEVRAYKKQADAKVSFILTRPVSRNWFVKEGTDVMYQALVLVHTPGFSRQVTVQQMCYSLKLRGIHVECSEDGIRRGLSEYALKYTLEMVRTHLEKKCGNCDLSTGPFVEPLDPTSRGAIQKTNDTNKEELEKSIKICRRKFRPTLVRSMIGNSSFDLSSVSFEITRPSFPKWLKEDGTFTCLAVEVNVNLPNFTGTADMNEICEGLKGQGIHVDGSESGLRRGLAEYALKLINNGITNHLEKKCDCGYFSGPFVVPPN